VRADHCGHQAQEGVDVSNSNASSSGIGLSGALFILFLALRLTDHIDWAWYWVAAPIWIPLGIVVAFALMLGAVALVIWLVERRAEKKRQAKMTQEQLSQRKQWQAALKQWGKR
jgi:uncharacterized integral membrane protein